MSYERRLQLEALPAEKGWGKWVGVVGCATELVERKFLNPLPIWITSPSGPCKADEAYLYERWHFAKNGQPNDMRTDCYTIWHDSYRYTDYWPTSKFLDSLCAASREELCQKAIALLDAEMDKLKKQVLDKEAIRKQFQ